MQQIDAAQNYYGLCRRRQHIYDGRACQAVMGGASQPQSKGGIKRDLHKQHAGDDHASVCNKLANCSNADEQPEFMQDKCAQAAELLGLHKETMQVQPRETLLAT